MIGFARELAWQPHLRQVFAQSNAVAVEVEAGELRDVGQSLRRQGLGAFVSNAALAEVEAGELRDVGQSLRRQGLGAFISNAALVEVEA
eukprot:scaffold3171_cov171-Pinguiococcus_pyrenoidosus.AAC.1